MKQLIPVIAGTALLAVLGVATVVLGGADDSPGLQLIGVLLVVGAVVLAVRSVRNARRAG